MWAKTNPHLIADLLMRFENFKNSAIRMLEGRRKMIGKPISGDELKDVLDRERSREEGRKQLELELKTIRPGECLLYEARTGILGDLGLSLFVGEVKGLKMITEGNKSYVYREK